jgi:energy-coupling factor transporter ATP-binding protein EcfA2
MPTDLALDACLARPPHALLLTGPPGIGKYTLAATWSGIVSSQPQSHIITPDEKGSIGIDAIRGLYRTVRGKHTDRQMVVVDHAETMSLEAQNAFLKLLEEPPAHVNFILTASLPEMLLPTVLSRVQHVYVKPLSEQTLRSWLETQGKRPAAEIAQLLFIAAGCPGRLVSLLTDSASFENESTLMLQAKELLGAKPYVRFTAIGKLTGDRLRCIAVLQAMQRMASLQLVKPTGTVHTKRWLTITEQLEAALTNLAGNGNVKAQLLRLFTAY